MKSQEAERLLEEMVDSKSLAWVLGLLAAVCYEKASDLEANWQDRPAAKLWTKAGAHISKAQNMVNDLDL